MSIESNKGNEGGDSGRVAGTFADRAASNRGIACRLLGDERYADIVSVVREGGVFSEDQMQRVKGILCDVRGCLNYASLLLVFSQPGGGHEKAGLEILKTIVDHFVGEEAGPGPVREALLKHLDGIATNLSRVEGKDGVKLLVEQKRDQLKHFDEAMMGVMASFGCSPKPGG